MNRTRRSAYDTPFAINVPIPKKRESNLEIKRGLLDISFYKISETDTKLLI